MYTLHKSWMVIARVGVMYLICITQGQGHKVHEAMVKDHINSNIWTLNSKGIPEWFAWWEHWEELHVLL